VEHGFYAYSTISFYLKDEPLHQIGQRDTSKEAWNALNFINTIGDQNTKRILDKGFWSYKTNEEM